MPNMNCMLDIETTDNRDTAAVLSAAAVFFNEEGVVEIYEGSPELQEQLDHGRTIGASTLRWWEEKAADEARRTAFAPAHTVKYNDFYRGLCDRIFEHGKASDSQKCQVWGYGSDFDQVILRSCAKSLGIQRSWNFRWNRCFRTLVAILDPEKKLFEGFGVAHDAKNDALAQAAHFTKLAEAYPNIRLFA